MGSQEIFEIKEEKSQRFAVDPCHAPCAIERGMRVIGGKWTGSILWHLKDGPVRFNDLARQLSGASKKMITQRLKEMHQNQLIRRTVISTQPIAVSYELTPLGHTAVEFLRNLNDWVITHDIQER